MPLIKILDEKQGLGKAGSIVEIESEHRKARWIELGRAAEPTDEEVEAFKKSDGKKPQTTKEAKAENTK